MIVKVYRNLKYGKDTPPLYSIMYKGHVIAREHRVLLHSVKFVVQEGGRQRVLKEKKKNVHAFVVGKLVGADGCFGTDKDCQTKFGLPVQYNPYKAAYFTFKDTDNKVNGAAGVLLNETGIQAVYTY